MDFAVPVVVIIVTRLTIVAKFGIIFGYHLVMTRNWENFGFFEELFWHSIFEIAFITNLLLFQGRFNLTK